MTDQIVIGAGFGRTGTLSLRAALNMLNVGPTYHMLDNIKNNDFAKFLALHSSKSRAEREKHLIAILTANGYKSSVDMPSSLFFEEILELSPKGKVLLSVRDSPEAWVKSAKDTIFSEKMRGPEHSPFFRRQFWKPIVSLIPFMPFKNFDKFEQIILKIFLGKEPDWSEENMKNVYINWIKHVQQVVPKDQLLIFNVKEGWEPLCNFLELPVPDEPFPRVNDKNSFKMRWRFMSAFVVIAIVVFYGGIAAVGYFLYRTFCS